MKAVRFDDYGSIEVLEVRDVPRPEPRPGQVLVAVRAAGINPSEAAIRAGVVREIFPATFPSGQGSDLAGVVEAVGTGTCVIALASERHHAWLRERGAVPVAYGDGVRERIMVAAEETPVAAFIDLVGRGYVELALELGIAKDRIDTIVDFPAVQK